MNAPKAFAVLGPTAGGKTALALNIAQSLPVEIISLDSALVYRGMDIGTAKPTAEELAAVPHYLIDIISPLESYSAADFVGDCVRLVNEIHARGRYPLIVGGTMMYFHALTEGLNDLPGADAAVRAQLQAEKNEHGLAGLYRRLQEVDPITAGRLKANDSQRIERFGSLSSDRQAFERTFHRAEAGRAFIGFMHGCPDSRRPSFITPPNRKTLFKYVGTRFPQ